MSSAFNAYCCAAAVEGNAAILKLVTCSIIRQGDLASGYVATGA